MHSSRITKAALLAGRITSRAPHVRGVGLLLAPVARYFRARAVEDVEVSVFGQRMLLDPSDAIGNALLFTPQWYDPRERSLVSTLVRSGDYVVDIGANIGTYTLLFARAVGPSGRVVAIEAEPRNAAKLRHNVACNGIGWTTIIEFGVSDKNERIPLHLNTEGNAGAHSFLQRVSSEHATQEVECRALSALIGPRQARLIKLDIEGFEWRVLHAFFRDASPAVWPSYIMLEDEPRHREADAVKLAEGQGYRIIARFDSNVFLELSTHAREV